MIKSRVCELLGIEFPIIQGGMGWVADGNLAAGVSDSGGLGMIACASAPKEFIREEILKAKSMTDKPFGLNIIANNQNAKDMVDLAIELKVPVVSTGAGNPLRFFPALKAAGIKIVPVCPSPIIAKKMEDEGADAVVVEGCEAGGHIGDMTTMSLIPQTAGKVSIPVIGAGGIADGRTAAAAFILGAEGIQMGTAFIVCDESTVHNNFKQKVIDANGWETLVTGRFAGHPVRSLKSPLTLKCLELEAQTDHDTLEKITIGSLRKAVKEGDFKEGSFMCGQSCGLVYKKDSAYNIMHSIIDEAESLLGNPYSKLKIKIKI